MPIMEPIKMTRQQWNKTPADLKTIEAGQFFMLHKEGDLSRIVPVVITTSSKPSHHNNKKE